MVIIKPAGTCQLDGFQTLHNNLITFLKLQQSLSPWWLIANKMENFGLEVGGGGGVGESNNSHSAQPTIYEKARSTVSILDHNFLAIIPGWPLIREK